MKRFTILTLFLLAQVVSATDWSIEAKIPEGQNRKNILNLDESKLKKYTEAGYIHALKYPIENTGLFLPYRPLERFIESTQTNPLKKFLFDLIGSRLSFKDIEGMYEWLGLSDFPEESAQGVFKIPYPNGVKPEYPMGASFVDTKWGLGLTFSCAACHTQSMFGKPVMGLFNKRPRANDFFMLGQKYAPKIPSFLFQLGTGATRDETLMFRRSKNNLKSVGALSPQTLGLDTSLAQVALSLAKRNEDEYATKNKKLQRNPRPNVLSHYVADSKPGTWWLLKYKTRWLSDGSIVAGNPILTNFLWNELGRGTDLKELEAWMQSNQKKIDELTAAVFATEAPTWSDFFPASEINIEKAKHGEKIFNDTCKKCHGSYEKGWSLSNASELSLEEQIATTKVNYHEQTPVKHVGTDLQRAEGMKAFADRLNELKISKTMKTIVKPQRGYVPPPLVGIFLRYPYFHNNSIPNLCALFTKPSERPKEFYQGPAENAETDFSKDCVGYPVGEAIPQDWKNEDARFDTSKPGMRNTGHYKMWLNEDGSEKYSLEDKKAVIEYLKTL